MDNNIERNIEKGTGLLEAALRTYGNGDIESAYRLYEKAGEFLREAHDRSLTENGRDEMKYGDNLNFGPLYRVFEANAPKLFRDRKRHGALKAIMETIRGNKVLSDEFAAYDAFSNPVNVDDANMYVNEAVDVMAKYTPKVLAENNRAFLEAMRANGFDENITVTDDEASMFESVEYLMTHKRGFGNIARTGAAKGVLCEYVEKHSRAVNGSDGIDAAYGEKLDEIVKKYDGMLSEDEIDLIKTVQDGNAEQSFNELKEEVEARLGELASGGSDADGWSEVLEQVKAKTFDKGTVLQEMAELMEIRSEISE